MSDAPPPVPPPVPPVPNGGVADATAQSGPRTTRGAGRLVDDGKGRAFPCDQCGADVEFDIRAQRMKCPFCSHEKDLQAPPSGAVAEQDFETRVAWLKERRAANGAPPASDVFEVRCGPCGANVAFKGALTSTECAFCGAPVTREKVHQGSAERVPVDGVLPFQVEASAAKRSLAGWVSSRWFAPGEFKRRGVEGRFAGVYVPYWTFDASTFNRYSGERGEHYYVTVGTGQNRRQERRTRWYPASGAFRLFFDDVMVVAAKDLPVPLLQKLEPWPLKKLKPFDAEFLSGFLAETYTVELEPGFREAKERMDAEIHEETLRQIGGDDQRVHEVRSVYDQITYKHLLLPVWLLSYRYGDTTYRIVVNAVTGEVQGTRPWSGWKIAGFVLAIVAGVALVAALAAGG